MDEYKLQDIWKKNLREFNDVMRLDSIIIRAMQEAIKEAQTDQLILSGVSNRISDSGLRELYRKGYNDGFDNKADDKLATNLIDKRIDRIKKNYGC